MSQYGRPTDDISVGNWASTPLWEKLDEVVADDATTEITLGGNQSSSFEVGLSSSITDPGVHTGHSVLVRAYRTATNKTGTLGFSLKCGSTTIATFAAVTLAGSYTDYQLDLTEGEAANITDYTDLSVIVTGVTGNPQTLHVTQVYFICPGGTIYNEDITLGAVGDIAASAIATIEESISLGAVGNMTVAGDLNPSYFYTDFSKYALSQAPYDWTIRWGTPSTFTISSDGDIGGKVLEYVYSAEDHYFLSLDDVGLVEDVEILAKTRLNSSNTSIDNAAGLCIRGTGTDGTENGYVLNFDVNSQTAKIGKYIAGSGQTAITGDSAFTFTYDQWIWVRWRVVGSTIQAKWWLDGDPEPAAWIKDFTNSDVTGAGRVGVFTRDGRADQWDYFSVATNGGTARLLKHTNFSEYTTDAQPDGWTPEWSVSDIQWRVRTDSDAIGTKVLKGELLSASSNSRNLIWGKVKDAEVLSKSSTTHIRPDAARGHQGSVLRTSGGIGTENGYCASLYSDSLGNGYELRVIKYLSGTAYNVDTYTFTWYANTHYWIRFRIIGNVVQAKVWKDGDPEPSSWQINTTDNDITGAGGYGVRNYYGYGDTHDYLYDFFAVATDGGTAQFHHFTDFSEYSTSSQPADWSKPWTVSTDAVWTVETGGDYGGKVLRCYIASDSGWSLLSWDDVPLMGDYDLLARIRTSTSAGYMMGVAGRTAGESSTDPTVFVCDCANLDSADPDNLDTWTKEYGQSGSTNHAKYATTIDTDTWYWVRFRRQGNSWKAKIWSGGPTDEPSAWQIETTVTANPDPGGSGLFQYDIGTSECDWFAVALGGDSAQYPELGGNNYYEEITLGSSLNISQAVVATFEPSVTLPASGNIANEVLGTFETSITLGAVGNISVIGGLLIEEAITLGMQGQFATSAQAILNAAITLGLTGDIQTAVQAVIGESITLAMSGNMAISVIADFLASITLAMNGNITTAQDAIISTAITLAASCDISNLAGLDLVESITLAMSGDISTSAVKIVEGAITLACNGDISCDVYLNAVAEIILAAALDANYDAIREINESISLGMLGDIDTEGGAIFDESINLDASMAILVVPGGEFNESISLGSNLNLVVAANKITEGAISLGVTVNQQIGCIAEIFASANFAMEAAIAIETIAEFAASIALGASADIDVAANKLVEESINLGATAGISTSPAMMIFAGINLGTSVDIDSDVTAIFEGNITLGAINEIVVICQATFDAVISFNAVTAMTVLGVNVSTKVIFTQSEITDISIQRILSDITVIRTIQDESIQRTIEEL